MNKFFWIAHIKYEFDIIAPKIEMHTVYTYRKQTNFLKTFYTGYLDCQMNFPRDQKSLLENLKTKLLCHMNAKQLFFIVNLCLYSLIIYLYVENT